MTTVLLILHLIVTLALIGAVLIQRSEGGGLGIGSSQGMGSFMSGRGTANLLTRTTAILAGIFMLLSLTLAVMNRGVSSRSRDILALPDSPAPASRTVLPAAPVAPPPSATAPAPGAATPAPATPVLPARPAAPATPAVPVPGH
ncbi:MAG: preprotein translocase subunit SecG [Caulobacteraceae bacterium]|nr:preprotein translocase subunit SecG [Caulobacter sp.]